MKTGPMAPIDLLFVLLPHSLLLDWAGPAEAFRLTNQALAQMGEAPRFRLRFVGPEGAACTSVGAMLAQIETLPEKLSDPSWVILSGSPSEHFIPSRPEHMAVTNWLSRIGGQLGKDNRLITVCAGALLAAHAGLLAGRRVTTHHQELEKLRAAEPRCDVVSNRVFVVDESGSVYSSAGITTGIDLALHLVAETCGEPLAARVAQTMVVALRRGPNDPELSPFLDYRNHMHPALHRVQDAVSQQPQDNWTVSLMAEVACTSPRHLTRLFTEHAGIAPLQYLSRIRLAVANSALRSGQNVTQAAALAGFSSDTQLRRAWHRLGQDGTPSNVSRRPC